MANLVMSGFDELDDAFNRIGDIPFSVTAEALTEMATVASDKIKSSGEQMGVRDPDSNVHILDKIKPAKPKPTETGGYCAITFSGTRTRNGVKTRNAEIAFVNEYGKRGQDARPFIRNGMQDQESIAAPGEKIIGDWIENEFKK